jgi:DHA1 family bicyclomycin/chloramphenicol resistance-like MFS transporter
MGANIANARLVARFGSRNLMYLGALVGALAGVLLLATSWTEWGGLWGLAVPLFLFVSCSGLIVANSIGMALADFPERAGAVSALVGAIHYGCGIVGSACVGALADGTPRPMAFVIVVAGAGSFLSLALVPRRRRY